MTRELFWLTLTTIMTGLMWVPYILDRISARGLKETMDNPRPDATPQSPWAMRLYFAHTNAVENLVIFGILVLVLNAVDAGSRTTEIACAVYFWARLTHAVIYAMGVPILRTFAFAVGFFAQAVIALAIFGVL